MTNAWRTKHGLEDALVCDGLMPWTDFFLPPGADLGAVLRRFRANGVDHISLTAAAGTDNAATARDTLAGLKQKLAPLPWVRVAAAPDEIREARGNGLMSVSFHFQSATPFADSLDAVDSFRAAGITRAILAYNEANVFADGCHEPRNAGLSARGRRLLERMDKAGIRVDLSHCGERTSMDALQEPLRTPPVFSHSNARALFDHERNIGDAQIRACAARGGYVGVNGVGMFLGADGPGLPRAMSEHIAHIAGIAGAERVGIGLDFMYLEGSDYGFYHATKHRWPRGYPEPPWSFLQPEQFGDLVDALAARGFSNAELRGILGGNYARLAY